MLFRATFLFIALLFLAGCSTTGTYLEAAEVDAAKSNISSVSELEAAFGYPNLVVPRAEGKDLWIYSGLHERAGATRYIPYLGLVIGTTKKHCTVLKVMVNRETGELSDWEYVDERDTDHWIRASEDCKDTK